MSDILSPESNFIEFSTDNLEYYLDNLWLELGDIRDIKLFNPFDNEEWNDKTKIPELLVENFRNPNFLPLFCKYILNISLVPYQSMALDALWKHSLPLLLGSRGSAKSFLLAVYAVCRAVLHQGARVVIVGASLRQAMVIFNYVQQIWDNAPVLRDIVGKNNAPKKDVALCYWNCGRSKLVFLPLGNGETIRGQRATHVIADEIATIPKEVFETVVRGFAAVKSQGVHGNVVQAYKEKAARELGLNVSAADMATFGIPTILKNNQIILSGTAFYQFNHFYDYFKYYNAVIKFKGDRHKIRESIPNIQLDNDIDPKDYCIIRLPYNYLPEGLMDTMVLEQGKATMDKNIFLMEYGTIFPSDSEGFYLASILNAATCPIKTSYGEINFAPKLYGQSEKVYVMGIDPASEDDNFAISILELNEDYRAIIYQWTTNRKTFEKLKKDGKVPKGIEDYNTFCIKHIRSLVRRFHITIICMDSGGGGISVKEGLRDPDKMDKGDLPIFDMDDETVKHERGWHMLKMIEFTDSAWRRESHYALKTDFSNKVLLFPNYDGAALMESNILTEDHNYENLEDNYLNILEAKTEITLIKHGQTANGTEKWDVPEIVGIGEGGKKKLKKDRFTSILLSNWAGRLHINQANIKQEQHKRDSFNAVVVSKNKMGSGPNIVPVNGGRKVIY